MSYFYGIRTSFYDNRTMPTTISLWVCHVAMVTLLVAIVNKIMPSTISARACHIVTTTKLVSIVTELYYQPKLLMYAMLLW